MPAGPDAQAAGLLMGPSIAVFGRIAFVETVLHEIDYVFTTAASEIRRTRKGRVWDVWILERLIYVSVETRRDAIENEDWHDEMLALDLMPEVVTVIVSLSAGCNDPVDYELLRALGLSIASVVNGVVSEPSK